MCQSLIANDRNIYVEENKCQMQAFSEGLLQAGQIYIGLSKEVARDFSKRFP